MNSRQLTPRRLFEAAKTADFTLTCGSDKYPVHRLLLALHSVYFERLFDTDFKVLLILHILTQYREHSDFVI